jgi:hypothetical protein
MIAEVVMDFGVFVSDDFFDEAVFLGEEEGRGFGNAVFTVRIVRLCICSTVLRSNFGGLPFSGEVTWPGRSSLVRVSMTKSSSEGLSAGSTGSLRIGDWDRL